MAKCCTIDGCEREAWARGWCSLHYGRWQRTGDPLKVHPKYWASTEPCAIDGCDVVVKCRGLCEKHYQRWWKHGSTDLQGVPNTGVCRIDGCHRSTGNRANICEVHYYRLRRTGRTQKTVPIRIDRPTYRSAHSRVARDRGKAKMHICADCDALGAHWSFAWKRVEQSEWMWERVNGTFLAYTGDVLDYDPRCHVCARRYDADFARSGWQTSASAA